MLMLNCFSGNWYVPPSQLGQPSPRCAEFTSPRTLNAESKNRNQFVLWIFKEQRLGPLYAGSVHTSVLLIIPLMSLQTTDKRRSGGWTLGGTGLDHWKARSAFMLTVDMWRCEFTGNEAIIIWMCSNSIIISHVNILRNGASSWTCC